MLEDLLTGILRIAAFSDGDSGGNPAGVMIADALPDAERMQRIAARVGFSETVFAAPIEERWRVRYFAPEGEIPFCGHATIALGAALAMRQGDGIFPLQLNETSITVEGKSGAGPVSAALQSPRTRSKAAAPGEISDVLSLFGYAYADIDWAVPPAFVHAGANHFALTLKSRQALAAMTYGMEEGRALMARHRLVTVLLAFAETPQLFHTRNPFASGGVYEDPATGAATAAYAGYLRDLGWPHAGAIDVVQGEDMGMRSRLHADIPPGPGSSIRVSGTARMMRPDE